VNDTQAADVHVVEAARDEIVEYWAIAAPRDQAVKIVRQYLPRDWVVKVTDRKLAPDDATAVGRRPGQPRRMRPGKLVAG